MMMSIPPRLRGVTEYATLSSLLASPPAGRATALDAPGSLFADDGGVWSGTPGRFARDTDASYIAYLAAIAAGSVYPAPSILIGPTPETAVAMVWRVDGYVDLAKYPPKNFSRLLRAGSIGDSIVNVSSATAWDIEFPPSAFPGSGLAGYTMRPHKGQWISTTKIPVIYVADGGIDGQTTTQILARSSATASASRASMYDILSKNLDLLHVSCGINNFYGSVAANASEATIQGIVDSVFADHEKIVGMAIDRGVIVSDVGLLGYSMASANASVVRRIINDVNALIAAASRNSDLWIYHDLTGSFRDAEGNILAGCSNDGLHPNWYGGLQISHVIERDLWFISAMRVGPSVYDSYASFVAGTLPADMTLTGTGVTVISASTDGRECITTFSVASNATVVSLGMTNSAFLALCAANKGKSLWFGVETKISMLDGSEVNAASAAQIVLYDALNAVGINTYLDGCGVDSSGYTQVWIPANIPDANIGTSSACRPRTFTLDAGSYVLTFKPLVVLQSP